MCFSKIFIICLLGYVLVATLNLQETSAQKERPVVITMSSYSRPVASAQEEGDRCISGRNIGVCRSLDDCPSAIQALQELRQNPTICSFPRGSTLPVICCVETDITKSKSYQKCVEYSQYIFEWKEISTQLGKERFKTNTCGRIAKGMVVGGTPSVHREFPHMAALGFGDGSTIKWECGGSLISERFVLTAGHCTFSQEHGEVKRVRVGALTIAKTEQISGPQELGIAEIIPHPEYKRPSRYNDIALLRIDGTFVLNQHTIPACLRWDPLIKETSAIATGWGRTSFGGDRSDILLKVNLELFSQPDCNASYASLISNRQLKFGIVPETQLCAGHNTEVKDVCQGDSGGPLQVYQENDIYCMYSIIGVTSFGIGCGTIGTPGVYTRVSAYVQWIESIVWP